MSRRIHLELVSLCDEYNLDLSFIDRPITLFDKVPREGSQDSAFFQSNIHQRADSLRKMRKKAEGSYQIMTKYLSRVSQAQVEGEKGTISPSSGGIAGDPSAAAAEGTPTGESPPQEGLKRPVRENCFPALRAIVALPIVEKLYVASTGLALVTAVLFCSVGALPPGPSWGRILLAMVGATTAVGGVGLALDIRRGLRNKRMVAKSY